MMNLHTLTWDAELLKIYCIPRNCLPEIVSSVMSSPPLTSLENPFKAEIPITGILGDQQAALFGQLCFDYGDTKNTYGTGCFLLMNTGTIPVFSDKGLLTTVAAKIFEEKATYALEGAVAVAGSGVQWLRDNLGLIKNSSDIEDLANSVDSSDGLYFVPAFNGLFAPWWNPGARGILCGLTHFHTKAHIARALLEAIAFQTMDVFNSMPKNCNEKSTCLKVDGGMTANSTLMQFQANVLGIDVVLPNEKETTALGVAFAAGLGVGFWKDKEELTKLWKTAKKWKPQAEKETIAKHIKHWHKTVKKSFDWEV